MTATIKDNWQDSDPVTLWIVFNHSSIRSPFCLNPGDQTTLYSLMDEILLEGYCYNFYRSRTQLLRVKREMVDMLLKNNPIMQNMCLSGHYKFVVEKFKIYFHRRDSWLWSVSGKSNLRRRRRQSYAKKYYVKIPLPRAHNIKDHPKLYFFKPYPFIPYVRLVVHTTLCLKPTQCRQPIFHDFFDSLLYRRKPHFVYSRKRRKRLAKRHRRQECWFDNDSSSLRLDVCQLLPKIVQLGIDVEKPIKTQN